MKKLRRFCNNARSNDNINDNLIDFILEYIRVSFEDVLPLLSHRNYMYRYCGWVADNCFTESENATLSKDEFGPKPNHRLHISGDAILQVSDSLLMSICAY